MLLLPKRQKSCAHVNAGEKNPRYIGNRRRDSFTGGIDVLRSTLNCFYSSIMYFATAQKQRGMRVDASGLMTRSPHWRMLGCDVAFAHKG